MRKFLNALDLLRAVAFIFVLIQHSIGGYSLDANAPINNVIFLRMIYSIAKPAVPMFFFISASVLFYTYKDNVNIIEFYKRRFSRTLLPYISCTIIYIVVYHIKVDNLLISFLNGNAVFHLWYMGALIQLYIIYPVIVFSLNKLNRKSNFINTLFLTCYFIFTIILLKNKDYINLFISVIFTGTSNFHIKEFMSISPIYFSIYILVGYYFIINYDDIVRIVYKYKLVIVLFFIIFLFLSYLILLKDILHIYINEYLQTAIVVVFNLISIMFWYNISTDLIKMKNRITHILKFIANYSFGGYLLHVFVLNQFAGILFSFYKLTNNYIFPSVLLFLLSLITTPFLCHILSLIPFSKYIFGVKRIEH